MHMPDVLQAEPPRVDDARRAARPNAAPDSARDASTGTETARNGSSFLAIIEEMLAGSMDGMDEIRQLSSQKTAEREAGGVNAPGESDALKKLGAGGATSARSGKNTQRAVGFSASGGADTAPAAGRSGATNARIGDGTDLAGLGRYRTRFDSAGSGKESSGEAGDAVAAKAVAKLSAGGPGEGGDASVGTESLATAADRAIDFASLATPLVGKETLAAGNGLAAGKDGSDAGAADERSVGNAGRASSRERKATINVRDERTFEAARERAAESAAAGVSGTETAETTETADGVADMSIGFRAERSSGGYGETQTALRAEGGRSGETSFSAMLSQELREQAGEFVKAGKIVLRDGNSGTIRLTLHPESLGNVRISLDLSSDRKITGKIHVASKEAYDAFLENLDGLSDAFVEGGFESAGFDLSWSGNGGYNGGDGSDTLSASAPFYASSVPDVMSAAKSTDRFDSGYRGYGMSAIDVFA